MTTMDVLTTTAAQEYLVAVEQELLDLATDERGELLEDLALHLSALDEDEDPRSPAERLGTPATYAAELRSAAGLPAKASPVVPAHLGRAARDSVQRLSVWWSAARQRPLAQSVAHAVRDAQRGWWALRGLVVAAALIEVRRRSLYSPDTLHPSVTTAEVLFGGFVVLGLMWASSELGRQSSPLARVLSMLLTGGTLIGLVTALSIHLGL